jgi:hypothetical protein
VDRRLVLEAVKHSPPAIATSRGDGLFDLVLNLNQVFHHGYIDKHGLPPELGTNPLFDEYRQLLDPTTDLLKWSRDIGRGDHKVGESHVLGRSFARAYLALNGYTWFADIKDLLKRPERGWSVTRPSKGDMPDWLIGDNGDRVAVAEAKGISRGVTKTSKKLRDEWRPQLRNVCVLKDGVSATIEKGWIIATRWVTSNQRIDPKMYAEDPLLLGDIDLGKEDRISLNLWLARTHTVRNLLRLGKPQIAFRVGFAGDTRQKFPLLNPVTWRCLAPGFDHLIFIGRPIGQLPNAPWFPWDWRSLRDFMPIPFDRVEWERWARLWTAVMDDAVDSTWFDGIAISTVTSVINGTMPKMPETQEVNMAEQPFVSLLSDGSLLAPMSLMKPEGRTKI